MSYLIDRQAVIDTVDSEVVSTNPEHFKSSEKFIKFMDDADIASFGKWQWANGFNTALVASKVKLEKLPPAQPEPTRIIPETRAIPLDDDRVSLSERVTATYYDDEYEEWSQRTVTVRDVLDAVCDEYTVLPTIQSEPKEGHWIPHESPDGGVQYECSRCGVLWEFTDGTPEDNEAYFCPKCGKKLITK